jgi:hypothetical protein
MARIAKPTMRPAEEAFVVTVGVSHSNKDADCATSDDAILTLAEQVELNRELADNDPTED